MIFPFGGTLPFATTWLRTRYSESEFADIVQMNNDFFLRGAVEVTSSFNFSSNVLDDYEDSDIEEVFPELGKINHIYSFKYF